MLHETSVPSAISTVPSPLLSVASRPSPVTHKLSTLAVVSFSPSQNTKEPCCLRRPRGAREMANSYSSENILMPAPMAGSYLSISSSAACLVPFRFVSTKIMYPSDQVLELSPTQFSPSVLTQTVIVLLLLTASALAVEITPTKSLYEVFS